jgi:hypothetical protein
MGGKAAVHFSQLSYCSSEGNKEENQNHNSGNPVDSPKFELHNSAATLTPLIPTQVYP